MKYSAQTNEEKLGFETYLDDCPHRSLYCYNSKLAPATVFSHFDLCAPDSALSLWQILNSDIKVHFLVFSCLLIYFACDTFSNIFFRLSNIH